MNPAGYHSSGGNATEENGAVTELKLGTYALTQSFRVLVARSFDVSCNPFCPVLQHSIYSSLTNAYCTWTGAGTETVTLSTSGLGARAQHATTITPHMCQPQGTESVLQRSSLAYAHTFPCTFICKLYLVVAYGANLSSRTNRKNRGCCIQQEKVVVVVIGMAGLPAPMQHMVTIVQLIAWFSWSTTINDTHRARYRPP